MKIFRNWTFTWKQVAIIKLCLISLGILLGLYFYDYLIDWMLLWWFIFLVTVAYFIVIRGKLK
jgi:hypothetical protein